MMTLDLHTKNRTLPGSITLWEMLESLINITDSLAGFQDLATGKSPSDTPYHNHCSQDQRLFHFLSVITNVLF